MKYVDSDIISVMEAIIGPAIRAGSIPIFLASIGSMDPMILAIITTSTIELQTVSATKGGL